MDEFVRRVYERGKVTIPKELRDIYGVRDGDLVKLRIVRVVQNTDLGAEKKEPTIEIVDDDDDAVEVA
ncbi:MAG: AbrB/MazE/SpoVT family DNA-binding domain-containing protein [Euryarchaeota archaeon]|nr:AbrB/MazE/SpoVT family DNA-binding domain-containing protein [Euryarchaeota archaeon]